MEAYGTGCTSYTLGVKVQYKCEKTMKARQYYDANGNIFRASTNTYTTYSPVPGTEQYKSVKTSEVR